MSDDKKTPPADSNDETSSQEEANPGDPIEFIPEVMKKYIIRGLSLLYNGDNLLDHQYSEVYHIIKLLQDKDPVEEAKLILIDMADYYKSKEPHPANFHFRIDKALAWLERQE